MSRLRSGALAALLSCPAAALEPSPATTVAVPPPAAARAVPPATVVAPPIRQDGNIVLPAALSPEARAEQHLLANAAALNAANQTLLTRNQRLALENESLGLQLRVLREQQQAEALIYGALAALAGVLLGWILAGLRRSGDRSW